MPLPNLQIVSTTTPSDLARHVAAREAALWLGADFSATPKGAEAAARLTTLTWQAVLLESTRGELAREVERRSGVVDRFSRVRGFVHVIAENPTDLTRSPRSLPVYMLNGRADATDPASSPVGLPKKLLLRRLSMVAEVQKLRPRLLVVVTDGNPDVLEEVFEGWGADGFAPRLVVVDPADKAGSAVEAWLARAPAGASVHRCVLPFPDFVGGLAEQVDSTLPDLRRVVRVLRADGSTRDVDLTDCELIEFPLLDRFDLILTRHLATLAPGDLTDEQINRFFEGTTGPEVDDRPEGGDEGWAAYAAGLPWLGRSDGVELTLQILDRTLNYGAEHNRLLLLPSESGAGGTTLARATALAAARAGYPTLVARDESFRPNADEVAAFLTRADQKAREADPGDEVTETPWLIVFDVSHWWGREADAVAFARELTRRGRAAVVLCVVQEVSEEYNRFPLEVAEKVRHDLSQTDAVALGEHLNRFLTPRGRAVPPSDWVAFWEKHSPLGGAVPASFWVALSFWLRKQINLDETIQGWLAHQFRTIEVPPGGWELALEVAALSVEREGTPEGVLAAPENHLAADILDRMRNSIRSLALHRVGTGERVWYVAHDLLGRLLLNIVFYDREALNRFGLGDAIDPIHLRILLLRRIASRPALTRKAHQALALEFPLTIFKLEDGRLEFARYWEDVLAALDAMPAAFRDTSRTFKHHAAVTRRRICTIREYFDLTPGRRRELLEQAVALLEEALGLPIVGVDDEANLNIYNSLALAYQNLADVEKELGAHPDRLALLWKRATEATQQAKKLNPRNSYVLETLARNLILTAKLYPDQAAERAAEALGYVYQAMSLEKAGQRQHSLLKYAQEAVDLLRAPSALSQAARLAAAGNPFGHLALAWRFLAGSTGVLAADTLDRFPKDRVRQALNQLASVAEPNPLVLQLRYDLVVAADQWAFPDQLAVLDALQINLPRMPLQLRVERAILLHQQNRHREANELFDEVRRVNRDPANQEYVVVPNHLDWLLVKDDRTGRMAKRVCDARVTGRKGDFRKWAKVPQLLNAEVPFNPKEFSATFSVGQVFKGFISFGHNGPFIKPAIGGGAVQ